MHEENGESRPVCVNADCAAYLMHPQEVEDAQARWDMECLEAQSKTQESETDGINS